MTTNLRALAARSKDDEKKLIGPLVRRLGGVPCALSYPDENRITHAGPREARGVQTDHSLP